MSAHYACPHCGYQPDRISGQGMLVGPCLRCGAFADSPPVIPGDGPPKPIPQLPKPGRWRGKLLAVAMVLTPILICSGLIALSIDKWPTGAAKARRLHQEDCAEQINRVGMALLAYHTAHGSFPPAVVFSPDGKPLYSWRVLILPHLGPEGAALYAQFDLTQAWDSDANKPLAAQRPAVFHCPADTTAGPTDTSYVVITGPRFVFDGPRTTKLSEIKDGADKTLLVTERAKSGIVWSEPLDLPKSATDFTVNNGPKSAIMSSHDDGGFIALADGSPQWIPGITDSEQVEALCTIDAGDRSP